MCASTDMFGHTVVWVTNYLKLLYNNKDYLIFISLEEFSGE